MMNEKLSWILGTTAILTTSLALLVIFSTVRANAVYEPPMAPELPGQFTYQGQLLDPDTENPVPDGKYDMLFTIYDAPDSGAILWEQTFSGANGVQVKSGQFTVYLGSALNPIRVDILDGEPRWLGVKVATDPEMTPRTPLTSVPFALRAEALRSGGITSDSLSSPLYTFNNTDSSGYALLAQGNMQIQGNLTWTTRTGYLSIPASAFRPSDDTHTYVNLGVELITTNGQGYYAAVNLPNGSTITDVTAYYYDDDPSEFGILAVYLSDFSLSSYSITHMATIYSVDGGYGNDHDDSIINSQVDNQAHSYYLFAHFFETGTGLRLEAVTIEYAYVEPY